MNRRQTIRMAATRRIPAWRRRFVLVLSVFCLAVLHAPAQEPVDWTDTWSAPGLSGWLGASTQVSFSNRYHYLEAGFKAQSYPAMTTFTARRPVSLTYVQRLSFRLLVHEAPSALRVCFHSTRSGNVWYVPVKPGWTGEWFTVELPVDYEAGWTTGPLRNRQDFINDLLAIDWIGIYARRGAGCNAQQVLVDDFRLEGIRIPERINMSGIVYYEGPQEGPVRVVATPIPAGSPESGLTDGPGAYQVDILQPLTRYAVHAFRDSNQNAVQDAWEAHGVADWNPVDVRFDSILGVEIALNDPVTPDGLPLWWVSQTFGEPVAGGGSGGGSLPAATDDPDDDGISNEQEFIAGTDPLDGASAFVVDTSMDEVVPDDVVLKWNSVAGRRYAVWRTANLMEPFVCVVVDLLATPPVNVYRDPEASGGGPYFYRIEVTYP